MSERMTDERVKDLLAAVPTEFGIRSGLRSHIDAQDATIKALADALGGDSGKGHRRSSTVGETRNSCRECCRFEPGHAEQCTTGRALRLAGRLP